MSYLKILKTLVTFSSENNQYIALNTDYIKTFLFIIAAIFPVVLIFKDSLVHYRKLLITILFVHLVLLFIVTFKLHHLLRDKLNIPNTITYIIGAIPFVVLFFKHKSELVIKETYLFLISVMFLAVAVIIDLVSDGKILEIPDNDTIEEIFRIAGAVLWLMFNFLLYSRLKKI
ncbi:Hypothetical protein IALB_2493 [Ignavibacterium album JCM 16511]|uniref:Transmembrane protein n=1 Tax=Ignavibacterium album (strain DSM 19864 / JCM 16511 / NBRC 101810 / Mat9-16) TaxID=945713 RepID=I0AMI9_IGNAJ|nr:hypothetical protein [Ignavibacterium album]AFH50196.1 Hypothetical protein IALB_2493 [Ignavibacterium album JCM 16511]